FFLFRAMSSSEIFTLSLHDALPISGSARLVEEIDGAMRKRLREAPTALGITTFLVTATSVSPLVEEAPLDLRAALVERRFLHQRDRKSTRLNSSHDQISYAVFCLKK